MPAIGGCSGKALLFLSISGKVVAVIVAVRALTRLRGLSCGSRRGAGRGRCVASRRDAVVFRHRCVRHCSRDVAMSREVAVEEEGVTLLDAIYAGRIPRPAEMTFPRWQAWRRGEGLRPTARRDG